MEILVNIPIQLLLNGITAALWLLLIRKLDKARSAKGRKQKLHRFLFAGMVSVPLAVGLGYGVLYAVTPLFTGIMPLNFFIDQFFVAGVTEELSKFFLFFIMTRRLNSIIEPRDGVLQALMNHPEDFELNYRAGRHCLYTHDFAAAAGYFSVCHNARPGHAKTCLCYTVALTGIRQYHQAKMVFYRRFVTISDNDAGKLWKEIRKLRLSYAVMNDLGVIFTCIASLHDISILNIRKMV